MPAKYTCGLEENGMRRVFVIAGLVALLAGATAASAQDLVITNARILDGMGGEVPRGSLVIRGGRIASVTTGTAPSVPGARVVDAGGRTVMPGFIDAHRHIINGNPATWLAQTGPAQMQQFLDAGFTTVVCAICSVEGVEMKRRIEAGTVTGPRLSVANIIPLSRPAGGPGGGRRGDPARFDNSRPPLRPTTAAAAIPPADTIAAVEALAKAGFDAIKTVITVTPGGPETETLKLIVSEGRRHNLPTITHAVTVIDTLAAIEARPAVLMHTPHIGRLEEDAAALQTIATAGIPMASTLAIFLPHFGDGNMPLFRDGLPFPWDTISSAGQGPVNARLLWQNGLTYGYGTDTSWPPRDSLRDELRALRLTFSPKDIVTIMGINAARAALRDAQVGSLEVGKLGDVVLVNGNPNEDSAALLDVVMTIKGGVVVSERGPS
jgi:imidazolonepropionase-like amidohydrolase